MEIDGGAGGGALERRGFYHLFNHFERTLGSSVIKLCDLMKISDPNAIYLRVVGAVICLNARIKFINTGEHDDNIYIKSSCTRRCRGFNQNFSKSDVDFSY